MKNKQRYCPSPECPSKKDENGGFTKDGYKNDSIVNPYYCPRCRTQLPDYIPENDTSSNNTPNFILVPEKNNKKNGGDFTMERNKNNKSSKTSKILGWSLLGLIILAVAIGGLWSLKDHTFGFGHLKGDKITVNTAEIGTIAALPQSQLEKEAKVEPKITVKDKMVHKADVVIDSKKSLYTNSIKPTDPKKPIVIDGDVHIKGKLEVDKKATFHDDVQIDKNLNVSGKITQNNKAIAVCTPAPIVAPTPVSTPKPTIAPTPTPTPAPFRKEGNFALEPNYAIIGDVKVNNIIRYDEGGSGESTIIVNKSSKGVDIYAQWGCGVQWYTDTDSLIKNELAHYPKVRLVVITDSGTTETFFNK